MLLSKVLRLKHAQEQSLGLILHYADTKGLDLVDLKPLRAVAAFRTSDEGRAELKDIGGLSGATVGRALTWRCGSPRCTGVMHRLWTASPRPSG